MDIVTAQHIPVGSKIVHAYWTAPRGYINPGQSFASEREALESAIQRVESAVNRHMEHYKGEHIIPLPETITIDYRWFWEFPNGGGFDVVASRMSYEDLTHARARLKAVIDFLV